MIERARVVAANSIGMQSGVADVMFEFSERGESTHSVNFGYYIAGGRLFLIDDRHGASITFSHGIITEIEVNFRMFSFTGEYTRLLPERQALAASGGEFVLCFSDAGSEILQPSWVKYEF